MTNDNELPPHIFAVAHAWLRWQHGRTSEEANKILVDRPGGAVRQEAIDVAVFALKIRRPPSITCPRCGLTSYHPKDIEQGYCGHCHDWTTYCQDWTSR